MYTSVVQLLLHNNKGASTTREHQLVKYEQILSVKGVEDFMDEVDVS